MKISREDIEYVAENARLELTEEEAITYAEQLNSILENAAKLQNVDTKDIAPTIYAVNLQNVLREDEVKPSIDLEKALANAPDSEGRFFKVPKIV